MIKRTQGAYNPQAEHMARAQLDIIINTAAARYTGPDLENYIKALYYCLERVIEIGEAKKWGQNINELLIEASQHILDSKPKQKKLPKKNVKLIR